MDNLDLLSDDELRRRLYQYGFPNLPVTATTRKVLIKKLRNHMENEKSKLKRETSYAIRYSSDEEASDKETTLKRRGIASRSTIGSLSRNMPPPATSSTHKSIVTKRNYSTPNQQKHPLQSSILSPLSVQQSLPIKSNVSTYVPPPILNLEDEDTGDDSDYLNTPNSSWNKSFNHQQYSSLRSTASPTYTKPPVPSYSNDARIDYNTSPLQNNNNHNNRWSINTNSSSIITGRNSAITNSHHNIQNTEDSPYISNYTKRLLSLRGNTVSESVQPKRPEPPINYDLRSRYLSKSLSPSNKQIHYYNHTTSVLENDGSNSSGSGGGVGGGTVANIVYQQHEQLSDENKFLPAFTRFFNKLDEQYSVKQTLVPYILLSFLILFFIIVAFTYLTISPNLASTLNTQNIIYTICPTSSPSHSSSSFDIDVLHKISTVTCIKETDIEPTIELLKMVIPELQRRIESHKCSNGDINGIGTTFTMSVHDIIDYVIGKDNHLSISNTIQTIHNMEYLINQNPQWKLYHCDKNGGLLTFEEIQALRSNKQYSFSILNPKLPFKCYILNKLKTFFLLIGTIGLTSLCIYIIYYFYRFITNMKRKRKEIVENLITDIINHLMEQSINNNNGNGNGNVSGTESDGGSMTQDNNNKNSIVVNHLRDKLVPITERHKLDWAWNEALEYLEQNESRIRFEITSRYGEDCRIMRWVDSASPVKMDGGGRIGGGGGGGPLSRIAKITNKQWQSPAFDKTNKIKDPPTTCLKIRQMFDKYEANNPQLKLIIQNAILEKVGNNCKIYDIQLDINSCCVYVRCATQKDAGLVHDEINGWWFDSRLVSIKFLREDRFMTRFPMSTNGSLYLRPSNTKKLSMPNDDSTTTIGGTVAVPSTKPSIPLKNNINRNYGIDSAYIEDYIETE